MRIRQTLLCNAAPAYTLHIVMIMVGAGVVGVWAGRAWCDPPAVRTSASERASGDALHAYRRIFVPADRVDIWPRDGRKYLPVEEKDFERWLAASANTKTAQTSIAIDEATYEGALNEADQFAGHGAWKISIHGEGPAFLGLPGKTLAIRNVRWKDQADELVRIGSWGTANGAPSEFGLVVAHSGWLEFDWSIRRQPKDNAFDVPWDVPAALSTRLTLQLPEGQVPSFDDGATLESTALPQNRGLANGSGAQRRWVLTHGPALGSRVLHVSSGAEARVGQPERLELRGKVNYQVEQRGVEIQAEWKLEGQYSEQRELTLPLPAGLQLLSVAAEGQELGWRTVRNPSPKADQAMISLPRDSENRLLNLKVAFWQPITLDQPWQLPSAWPENVFWRAMEMVLSVAPELELRRLDPVDCQQTGVTHLGADATEPEVFSFAAFAPTSVLGVALSRREADIRVRTGTSLALTDPDVIGKLIARWSVSRGQVHRLSGTLGRGWTIETVETVPADAVAEWFIERQDDHRNLEIRLTDAITPTREISVIVTGRLQRFNAAEPMSADMLRLVDWNAVHVMRQLLSFQSTEPYVVETSGGATVAPPETVDEGDLALLDETAEKSGILDLANASKDASVRLVARRGQYSAEIGYEAEWSGEAIKHSWEIVAQPRSNAIDRLLVYSTAPLGSSAHWSEKATDLPISAELLAADDPLRKNLPREGEVWLLRLPRSSSKPVAIALSIGGTLPSRSTVPILALPEAVEQSGHVTVRTPPDVMPTVEAAGFQSLPLALETTEPRRRLEPPARLTYRYAPQDCFEPTRAPRLEIGIATKTSAPLLSIRQLNVETFYGIGESTRHRVTYELENLGAAEFQATFDENARVSAVYVDGLPVPLTPNTTPTQSIPLSSRAPSSNVTFFLETPERRLAVYSTIAPPVAQEPYPILASEWSIWLPQDLAATGDSGSESLFNWRQRIFGFLAPEGHPQSLEISKLMSWTGLIGRAVERGDDGNRVREEANREMSGIPFAGALVSIPVPGAAPVNLIPASIITLQDTTPATTTADSELLGWHPVVRRFVGSGPQGMVAIGRPATIRSWAIACLLISFFINLSSRLKWRVRIIEIIVACCLALTLPNAVVPLATGFVWGAGLSQLWKWWIGSEHSVLPAQSGVSLATLAMLALVLLTGGGNRLLAAETDMRTPPHTEGQTATMQIESVLIPIDAQRKPVGTKVFLSDQFLRDLLGKSQGSTFENHSWLIAAASYSGELTDTRRSAEFTASDWTLAFNLETSSRQTRVRLPLVREEAVWQPSAMLDGVPQPIIWAEDGRSCVVTISEPGRYILSIFCTPKIEKAGGRGQLHLSVPKMPIAKLALQLPQALSGFQFPNAIVSPRAKDRAGFLAGELIQSDRINLSWDLTAAKEAAAQRLNISELSWLNVGEQGAELTTKFLVEGGARRPDSMTVRYDDRWTLLTDGRQPTKELQPTKTGHFLSLQLPFPADKADRQELVVRWRLSNAPEIGNMRVAPIAISPTPAAQRWFAVSTDSSVDCALTDNSIATATTKEFQGKWGELGEMPAPLIALANVPDDKPLTFSIRPREQTTAVRELLHVAAGLPTTRVFYQADVASGRLNAFQFRLSVSPTLNVDRIALSTGDQQVPIRWNRDEATRITVFFSTPVRKEFRLTVSGSIPNSEGQAFAVPRVFALQNGPVSQAVQLYRKDNVNLSLQGFPEPNGAKPGNSTAPPIEWLVRPIGAYTLSESALQAGRMIVEANRPVVQGNSLTQLSFKDGKWWAELRCRLLVEQGSLDVLQLSVPDSCIGPFDIDSSVPVATDSKSQTEGRHMLTVRLGTAVAKGKEITLRLRTSLAAASGIAPAVPDIQVAPFSGRRLIGVPRALNSQSLSWTNVGTKPIEIPDDWRGTILDATAYSFFEAGNGPFTVELQSQTVRQPTPGIRLAETYAALDPDGRRLLVSRFAVMPNGITECILSLPANEQLISALLDSQPAVAAPINATEWRVTLESANLPQMLTVISRAANAASLQRPMLERPTLRTDAGPLPTDISLWSLVQPAGTEPIVAETATSVSSVDFEALKFDRLVSLVEKVAAEVESLPPANAARWRSDWGTIVDEARTAALHADDTSASVPTIASPSYSVEEQIHLATKRFEAWGKANMVSTWPASSQPISWTGSTSRFNVAADLERQNAKVTNYVFDGEKNSISLKTPGIVANSITRRFMAVVIVVATGALLFWLASNARALDCVCRWPHALGVLVGVFYWAFLWPSWFGIFIVVASVWLALRTTWPGRAIRPEASTVLRSTRTLPSQ